MKAFFVCMAVYYLLLLGWSTAAPMDFFLDYHTVQPWVHTLMWVYLPLGLGIFFALNIATEWKILLLIIELAVTMID